MLHLGIIYNLQHQEYYFNQYPVINISSLAPVFLEDPKSGLGFLSLI